MASCKGCKTVAFQEDTAPGQGPFVMVHAPVRKTFWKISVTTEDSLSLISQDALLLQSEQLQLASDQAHCLVNDMQYVGKQVQSQIDRLYKDK